MTPSQYEILAARRLQWDALLWQVPALSLTGQAFLLVIALGDSSSASSRAVASGLGLILSVVSVMSLSRHRLAELSDARAMSEYETEHNLALISGWAFKDRRDGERRGLLSPTHDRGQDCQRLWNRLMRRIYLIPDVIVWVSTSGRAYPVWIYTFMAFGVVEAVILLASLGVVVSTQ